MWAVGCCILFSSSDPPSLPLFFASNALMPYDKMPEWLRLLAMVNLLSHTIDSIRVLVCWYTCMLYPGMEPTNNLGEQAIREHIILRKIIGCFRSENGAENYQYNASLLADWRLQGKNGFEELEQLLR